MARINLLPWREELRTKKQTEFVAMLAGTAVFMGLVMFGVHTQIETEKDHQNQRNGFLSKEIKLVDGKIKEIEKIEKTKTGLIARMEVIQNLQSSRPQIVHVFDEMARAIPDGVSMHEMKQKGDVFTVKGTAESNARVSTFLRNMEASEWLGSPKLGSIVKLRRNTLSEFTISVKQIDPNKPKKVAEEGKKKKKGRRR